MGTNYYVESNRCDGCDRFDSEHLGKSSFGWKFTLHVTDETPDLDAWIARFRAGQKIKDEYGRSISWEDLSMLIASKSDLKHDPDAIDCGTHDAMKREFS